MDFVILCKDIFGPRCEYEAHGESAEEAIENLKKHAKEIHGISDAHLKNELTIQAMKDKVIFENEEL